MWLNECRLFPTHTVTVFFHDCFQLLNRHLRGIVLLIGFHVKCSFRIICKYLITIYICPTEIGYRSVYTSGNKLFSDFCDFQCFVVVEISFLCESQININHWKSLEIKFSFVTWLSVLFQLFPLISNDSQRFSAVSDHFQCSPTILYHFYVLNLKQWFLMISVEL